MTEKKTQEASGMGVRERMIAAALSIASKGDWNNIELSDIAEKAGIPIEDVYERFDEKSDILASYDRSVNRHAIANSDLSDDLSCREKLFDLLMERFDILNENREALIAIMLSFKGDPKEAVLSFPHLGKSMSRLLEAAGISTNGLSGALRVTGLMGIYLYVVKTWKEDENADMAKTMAALDKALDKCEMFNNSLLNKMPCSRD